MLPTVPLATVLGKSGFKFAPQQYMGDNDAAALAALFASVDPKVVAEFGVNIGNTAKRLLDNLPNIQRYFGVDVFGNYKFEIPAQSSEQPGEPGILAKADKRFELILKPKGTRDLFPDDLPLCDAVFVDGDHGYHSVMYDATLAAAIIKPGGIIVFHDYGNSTAEVTAALNKLAEEGRKIYSIEQTWMAFERR